MASTVANPGIPNTRDLSRSFRDAAWGTVGGLGVALGTALLGVPLGTVGGALLTGAAVGGDVGRIITVNGVMDAVVAALTPAQGQ